MSVRHAFPRRFLLLFALLACGDDAAPPAEPDPLAACAAMGGAEPNTVADAIARLNALPEPASVACFLASLPRPLHVVATNSIFSAQPADGDGSPRLFILTEGLAMSVVPSGFGGALLEFGEWVTPLRTIKAEVEFPLERPLSDTHAYERVHDSGSLSDCGFCHTNEEPHPSIAGAFVSDAFQLLDGMEVTLSELRALRNACNSGPSLNDAGEDTCLFWRALFDHGEVIQGAFSPDLKRFF